MSDVSRSVKDFFGEELTQEMLDKGVDPEYMHHVYLDHNIPAQKFRDALRAKLHVLEPFLDMEENLREQLDALSDLKKGLLRDVVVEDKEVPDLSEWEGVDADE